MSHISVWKTRCCNLSWESCGIIAWCVCLISGFFSLLKHDKSPDVLDMTLLVPQNVHADSLLTNGICQDDGELTLVMAVHPKCPCTLNSITSLERLIAESKEPLTCVLLITTPSNSGDDWKDTEIIRRSRLLSGVRFVEDPEGKSAKTLGLQTSGEVIIFRSGSDTLYQGGITGSRSCPGDNPNYQRALATLSGKTESSGGSGNVVFGCKLIQARNGINP